MTSNSGHTTPGAGDAQDSTPEKSSASMEAEKPRKKGKFTDWSLLPDGDN
jgi:hypothetical protein